MKPVTVEPKFPNHGLVILEGVDTNTNSRNHFFGSFLVLRFFKVAPRDNKDQKESNYYN